MWKNWPIVMRWRRYQYKKKQLAYIPMNKTQSISSRNQGKQKMKIKLYEAWINSLVLHNCSTWGVPSSSQQRLDAFRRMQLKGVLGIKFPTRMSDKQLFEKTGEKPISSVMRKATWEFFGHVLRRDRNIPAYKAVKSYKWQQKDLEANQEPICPKYWKMT